MCSSDLRILAVGAGYSVIDVLNLIARMRTKAVVSSSEFATTAIRRSAPRLGYTPGYQSENYLAGIVRNDEQLQLPLWETELVEVIGANGRLTHVKLRDTKNDREFVEPVDLLFLALGFLGPDKSLLDCFARCGESVARKEYGRDQWLVRANGWNETNVPRVSVAGDNMLGASTLAQAGAEGMRTAWAVHQRLVGKPFGLLPRPDGMNSIPTVLGRR